MNSSARSLTCAVDVLGLAVALLVAPHEDGIHVPAPGLVREDLVEAVSRRHHLVGHVPAVGVQGSQGVPPIQETTQALAPQGCDEKRF